MTPCTKCGNTDIPKKKYKTTIKGRVYHIITRICKACLKDMDADYRERKSVKLRKREYANKYYQNNKEKLNKQRRKNYHKQRNRIVDSYLISL